MQASRLSRDGEVLQRGEMEKEQVLESRHSSSGSEITNLGLADYNSSGNQLWPVL